MGKLYLCDWPTKSEINFYFGRGKFYDPISGRDFDLSDELMDWWSMTTITFQLGLSDGNKSWVEWDKQTLENIEQLIRYDLGMDGNRVTINRISEIHGAKCSEEFI